MVYREQNSWIIISSLVGEGRPGSSLALPVAVSISVFIAVLTTVIVIIFILLRYVYTVGVMIITKSFNIIFSSDTSVMPGRGTRSKRATCL